MHVYKPQEKMPADLRASHGDERAVNEISRKLEDADSQVRESAAHELELLNNPFMIDPLGRYLVKHHSRKALRALANFGDMCAAEYMYDALNADDYWWQPRQEKMGVGDHAPAPGEEHEWIYITVYPYDEEMKVNLRRLGGQRLVMQTFVRLAVDPESRRREVAADVLARFAGGSGAPGFDKDPGIRKIMVDAAHSLARGSIKQQAAASQILDYMSGRKRRST